MGIEIEALPFISSIVLGFFGVVVGIVLGTIQRIKNEENKFALAGLFLGYGYLLGY